MLGKDHTGVKRMAWEAQVPSYHHSINQAMAAKPLKGRMELQTVLDVGAEIREDFSSDAVLLNCDLLFQPEVSTVLWLMPTRSFIATVHFKGGEDPFFQRVQHYTFNIKRCSSHVRAGHTREHQTDAGEHDLILPIFQSTNLIQCRSYRIAPNWIMPPVYTAPAVSRAESPRSSFQYLLFQDQLRFKRKKLEQTEVLVEKTSANIFIAFKRPYILYGQ